MLKWHHSIADAPRADRIIAMRCTWTKAVYFACWCRAHTMYEALNHPGVFLPIAWREISDVEEAAFRMLVRQLQEKQDHEKG